MHKYCARRKKPQITSLFIAASLSLLHISLKPHESHASTQKRRAESSHISSKTINHQNGSIPIAKPDSDAWLQLKGYNANNIKEQFPEDAFLSLMKEADIAILNNFGLDAPAILLKYSSDLYEIAVSLDLHPPSHPNLRNSKPDANVKKILAKSHFIRALKKESKNIYEENGPNILEKLNTYSNSLEDFLLKSVQKEAISEKELQNQLSKISIPNWQKNNALPELDKIIRQKAEDAKIAEGYGFIMKAAGIWQQLFEWAEGSYGGKHKSVRICLKKLADLYAKLSFFGEAEAYYSRLIKSEEEANQASKHDYAEAVAARGGMHLQMGLLQSAEKLLLKAHNTYSRFQEKGSYPPTYLYRNLASLYAAMDDTGKADYFFKLANHQTKELWGEASIELAKLQIEHSRYLAGKGDYATAEKKIKNSIEIFKGRSFGGEDYISDSLLELSKIHTKNNNTQKAEQLLDLLIDGLQENRSIATPTTVDILTNKAKALIVKSDYKSAITFLNQGVKAGGEFIQREVPLLPSHSRNSLTSLPRETGALAFSISTKEALAPKQALFTRLNLHGLLEEIEKRQAKLATLHKGNQQEYAQLKEITRSISSLTLDKSIRDELWAKKEEIEKKIYRILPQLKPRIVEVEQVAAALPADAVLIEFQRYQPFDAKKPPEKRWGEARYLAMVLKPDGAIAVVDLGQADVLEQAVSAAISTAQQAQSDAPEKFIRVSQLLLEPLQQATAGANTWFVSPDAELNRLPFAALPMPGSAGYLSEAVNLNLITTGRELLDLQQPRPSAKSSALVVANPAYNRNGGTGSAALVAQAQGTSTDSRQRSSAMPDRLQWEPLPATAAEGESVKAITGGTLLLQQQATAEAVKRTPAPKLLHLASHAFYLPNQKEEQPGAASKPQLQASSQGVVQTKNLKGESALLRSGIALAGANQPNADPNDDGYLTALEVAQLDWEGTEMVVISACESGLGDLQVGEGVYGLKRAIAVAGARSSLLTLWKVDDDATRLFMESFYQRLKQGEGKAAALAATQKEFRDSPELSAYSHPYYWAAFQLTGDGGPIKGL